MKVAITGGTGFIGSHLAQALTAEGHEVVLISRTRKITPSLSSAFVATIGLSDTNALAAAFAGCDAVAHCAGINREFGDQTYEQVHVEDTRHVLDAAKRAGVRKLVFVSFLRA